MDDEPGLKDTEIRPKPAGAANINKCVVLCIVGRTKSAAKTALHKFHAIQTSEATRNSYAG